MAKPAHSGLILSRTIKHNANIQFLAKWRTILSTWYFVGFPNYGLADAAAALAGPQSIRCYLFELSLVKKIVLHMMAKVDG